MPDSPIVPALWISLFEREDQPGLPLRERVCAALRGAIRRGELAQGARLPSTRMLAADLAISRVTAEAAYAQLEAEGYVTRRVGHGTVVSIASPGWQPAPPMTGIDTSATLSRRGAAIVATGGCQDPLVPRAFCAGSPDLRAFPVETWRQITARQLRRHGAALMGYGDPQGYAPLRDAIAGYLAQSRGVRCDRDQVVVLTSSQQALQLLAMLLLDPGDTVHIEEPGYVGARNAFGSAGAQLEPIPVDAEGMSLPSQAARLTYLTPSHQYPTGATLSLARRLALLEQAQRDGGWIIEDDYDSEFRYDARPLPAMQGLDRHGRVIYLGTFSKVLFPSLRLAYAVLPPALVEAVVKARTVMDGHSAQLAQAVTAEFIAHGHFARHLRQMRLLYGSRRALLLERLEAARLDWLRPQPGAGGLQLAAHLPPGREAALTRQAGARGIATPSLSALFMGADKQDGWLLGFAALQNEDIIDAVARLAS
ncbi:MULTISPECIES: PLP-dependent aminotransferase family protein [unclassified Massilia]|uniref:MocR-like pyridoxine biosynthesis transcription factor PdxR n=1 Tax=unclassified Massilia TaxID=2609279 RepID=UPI001B840498|nr:MULTISPECIES: PLP-dependent aminotransferase family protein [unclassified Massilia]MBQ5941470.1 PLP-dependent aminotransferase family protein [Massilia sp. AB1]MBQ5964061.1 PLP-dependent aminotransferase family protein [Massilia sp. ZL223]